MSFRYLCKRLPFMAGPVLDLCCGSGRLTIPVAKLGMDVTGVDLSGDMLAQLEENLNVKNKRLKKPDSFVSSGYDGAESTASIWRDYDWRYKYSFAQRLFSEFL